MKAKDLQNSSSITIMLKMVFSKKFKFIIYFLVLTLSIYIGFILGNTFCSTNCTYTIAYNILITNTVMVGGVFTLIKLSEKSITEWNDDNYYEKDWSVFISFSLFSEVTSLWKTNLMTFSLR